MKLTNAIARIIIWTLIGIGSVNAQTIYVAQGATGDGSSWQNAAGDLRLALVTATAGDEIWISGGIYTPTTCSPCSVADRDVRFVLPKGVKVRGGFNGTETSPDDRTDIISPSGPGSAVILSGQIESGVDSTRSFTVMESIAPEAGTLIERIQFEDGLANHSTQGTSSRGQSGALLYVTSYDTLTKIELSVDRCTFLRGDAIGYGGGMFVGTDFSKRAELQVNNCGFVENHAGLGGGGLVIDASFGGYDSSSITKCDFDLNVADTRGGGGLLLRAAEGGKIRTQIQDAYFVENSTEFGSGGGLRLYGNNGDCSPGIDQTDFDSNSAKFGGGLNINAAYGGISNPVLRNCTFDNNTSSNAGGAVYVSVFLNGESDFEIYQTRFEGNLSGESGGAILTNAIEGSSRALYRDCRFIGNEATLYGGAVYNLGKSGVCSPTFINCIIADNTASSAGGVYCLGSERGESSPVILNCVFEGNEALVGGALYSNANDSTGTAEPFVSNTVFFDNYADNGPTLRIIYGRPHLLNCYIDEPDCESLNSGFGGEPVCLGENQFNTAEVFDPMSGPYEYIALPNSPIIDAGNDSVLIANQVFMDYARDARFRGSSSDIGINELSSDPILWELLVDSTSISACKGSEVNLNASIYPPFPHSGIHWIIGSDTVSQGEFYTINELLNTQTIQVRGTLLGESRSAQLVINAIPTIQTSLTTDVSDFPDTLCTDSTYFLRAVIEANGADYSVRWLDEDTNILSRSEVLALVPTSTTPVSRRVEVEFSGNCLDTTSRSESIVFDVANCRTSSSQQTSENEALIAFPNPVKDYLTLKGLTGSGPFEVRIHNSSGQITYSGTMSVPDTTLNVYSLPQGLYTLVVLDEQIIYRVLIKKL